MYGLNAMAFALFIGINVLSHWLSKCTEKTRVRVLRVFCSLLLFGNILIFLGLFNPENVRTVILKDRFPYGYV